MLYRVSRLLLRALYGALFRLEARGLENIPAHGPVILASNHISNFDPPTIGIWVPRKVSFMAKAELFEIPFVGGLLKKLGAFPVKRGGVSKEAIRSAISLLQNGGTLGIFPEGTRNNESGSAKKGTAMIALRSGAQVVPVAIAGRYKLFRKMYVIYGKPIDLTPFLHDDSPDVLERVTEAIMSQIRQLRNSV
ncbi:lysophospholipid acyltransferase family protein [Paenibacillus cisolokensis]|jgi:1-acyl-sn-glycerol-3-phosphate acyltransferase|uniref:1-acyl-sn-glycerol-3-phosphate acyltransferase n=1 Tax=Paenibacillus cisolokensis TaxID=1658519 RepID=A0ABQ4N0M1_9BACL|nr:lysophospholipid acyltransferase family protein [Paenibacillus cisolokensis]GIQ61731.1 1-acyl-sn-glycerol-3-phosphate acyltransferase [Paenibacillus cisolokensis]